LVPLHDESLRVIGALAVVQGIMKKGEKYNDEKLTTLTTQVVEDILEKEAEVNKEVSIARETLQNFMEVWKGRTQLA